MTYPANLINNPFLNPDIKHDLEMMAHHYTNALIAYHTGEGSFDDVATYQEALNDLCMEAAQELTCGA